MSRTTMLHIGSLEPHPDNIRESVGDISETAASIRSHGILQPLTVVPRDDKPGHYYVIAGNRRYYAAKRARLDHLPVIIRRDDLTVAQITEIMLIENCQRRDLNPVEKAEAMGRLRKAGKSVVEIARSIGMSDASVHQYLALLELTPAAQEKIIRRELSIMDAVRAVRKAREKQRRAAGEKSRSAAAMTTWEPDHFTARHPLARQAQAMCDARQHNQRRRIGKAACGQCWETAIRADERLAQSVTEMASAMRAVPAPGEFAEDAQPVTPRVVA